MYQGLDKFISFLNDILKKIKNNDDYYLKKVINLFIYLNNL